jgi:two-component system sensor histidine kinase/response regulator
VHNDITEAAGSPDSPEDILVLIANENSADLKNLQEEMLSHWRIRSVAADGMESALAVFDRAAVDGYPFALVILDAKISGGKGLEFIENLGAAGSGRPAIVVLTSGTDTHEAEEFRALGVRAYLQTPITRVELLDAINAAIASESLDRLSAFSTQVSSSTVAQPGRARRILVATGDPLAQRLLPRMLERRGHSVVLVCGGREAVAAFGEQRFDILLLDVQTPDMNGIEAAAAIRAEEGQGPAARIPIFAITEKAAKCDREQYLASGIDGCIARPIQPGELFDIVENLSIIQVSDSEITFDSELFGGDVEFLAEIVTLFLETCPELLSEIEDAISREDATGLYRSAHTLKGAVAHFGAKAVVEQASALEMMGRNRNLSSAADGSAVLRVLMDKFVLELRSALSRAKEEQVLL